MSAFIAWGATTLAGATVMLLIVLLLRAPARWLVGPRLAYVLWALPILHLMLAAMPFDMPGALSGGVARPLSILFTGPRGTAAAPVAAAGWSIATLIFLVWLVGAGTLFAVHALRHWRFCRGLRASGNEIGDVGGVRIIATTVESPLAYGVFDRFIAVPRDFERDYTPDERRLVLAHEAAHHARGDLVANWASLVLLAAHWWNPIAWGAIRAFRDDQELATDALVLGRCGAGVRATYAHVLAKAAGIGALPASNLNPRSNLKGRLMMLGQTPRSTRRRLAGGAALLLIGGSALAATTSGSADTNQAVTLAVKPDGTGKFIMIVNGKVVAMKGPLSGGAKLPADFAAPAGCDLKPGAKPYAMVIKGEGPTRTYTVSCASAAPASIKATLTEALTSLNNVRASVATQPASAVFPETERAHALGAIDTSIKELESQIASKG